MTRVSTIDESQAWVPSVDPLLTITILVNSSLRVSSTVFQFAETIECHYQCRIFHRTETVNTGIG